MRLVRPPLVRMDVTMSSLSSKAFSCSSVVRCSLLSGSNTESTEERKRGTKKKKRGGDDVDGTVTRKQTGFYSELTIIPSAVVEAVFVGSVLEVHARAGVQADALKLPVGLAENGPAHLPQL